MTMSMSGQNPADATLNTTLSMKMTASMTMELITP